MEHTPRRAKRRRLLASLPVNASLIGAGRTLWLSHVLYSRLGVFKKRHSISVSCLLETLAAKYLDGELHVDGLPVLKAAVRPGDHPAGVEGFAPVRRPAAKKNPDSAASTPRKPSKKFTLRPPSTPEAPILPLAAKEPEMLTLSPPVETN